MPKKEKTEGLLSSEELAKFDRWFNDAEGARKKIDWKWFQYDLWTAGLHYAKWDRNTQQIITTETDGRPKVTINKIFTTLRAVRNYVLRNRPKAEVTPHWSSENKEALKKVSGQNKFLDFFHDDQDLRYKLKGSVWEALKYSIAYWQILFDEDADDGKGGIVVNDIDPYDLYWDPKARNEGEARYACIAVRRNIEDDLKHSSLYDQTEVAKIKGDKKMAASSLKERFIRFEMGETSTGGDEGTTIIREFWHKKWDEKSKRNDIWVTTIADGRCIRNDKTDLSRIPIFVLHSDINPRSMYGHGWVRDLISPQKELDRTLSHIAEWNFIMNRGKWIADVGSGVRVINNENGQIIYKKRGYEVKQGTIVPMSPIAFSLKDSFDTYIEDIGGFHDASMGRIPPGARSGDAVEALQNGDANNMSEVVENTEDFLEEVFEYVLSLAADKFQFARDITPLSSTGQREYLQVIGEDAAERAPEGTIVLPKKSLVDVKLTSWLAHTPEARQKKARELFEMQAIDVQTLLEFYEIGNVADVVTRVEEKKEKEMQQQMAQQKEMMTAQSEASTPATQEAGTQQAIAAIRSILQGEAPIIPSTASPEFIDYMDYFLETEESLTPEQKQTIQAFRDQVVQTAGRPFNK